VKRLSRNEVEKEIFMVTTEVQEPKMQPITGDWTKDDDPRSESFRWRGPSVSGKKEPLPNEVLAAFGSEARRLGRALSDAERAAIIARHK
jgi:hypothetical protein